ncbi:unnamed protein product [Phaedon cochleariae]|uniref:C2H2-type domain-containing protein n=1 Tax=Phaedon cochleariae TaxID=80249 RepID=A0A9N9SK59_PHACE|nr:unnamed protein product [Phaedon cochleariae]CAH1183462.1 unnamed protein product [Phaedon cochleariae]
MESPLAKLDFEKICRICMNEGTMMSIFKVNVSKKMMACAAVQVWPNDGLPAQICNRCSAKLHIAFQFKKQCEKSDGKLRQMKFNRPLDVPQEQVQLQEEIQSNQVEPQQVITQELSQTVPQNNCIYIGCNPGAEPIQGTFISTTQTQPQSLGQMGYQPENNVQLSAYSLNDVGQPQVYTSISGTFDIPLQPVTGILHNQMAHQIQLQTQHVTSLQPPPLQPRPIVQTEDNDDKSPTEGSEKQCPTCKKVFGNANKLSRHRKTHSPDMPYKCKVCAKAFSHSGNFKIHMRMHTGERPFRCMVCGKGCRQAQDLEKHIRTHTGERPHKCATCPKAFSTRSNLIAHIRTHTGERPYVCCVCQKGFCQSNELTKHMRTHTGEKSHICDICNKGFNGSSTLIVHRRSHTGERPYACAVCERGFAQSSCLTVHMRRHGDHQKHLCQLCCKRFPTSEKLSEHARIAHADEEPAEKAEKT